MLYMIIEHFKNGDARPVYQRFRERGRLAPEGLNYIASWIDLHFKRCYQIMETSEPELLKIWIEHWDDIVEFEVIPVMTSAEAAEQMTPFLRNYNTASN